MKLSVSLSESDIAAIDRYVEQAGLRSRSAAVQRAVKLLQGSELEDEYRAAFEEWHQSEDRILWEVAAADGIDSSTR